MPLIWKCLIRCEICELKERNLFAYKHLEFVNLEQDQLKCPSNIKNIKMMTPSFENFAFTALTLMSNWECWLSFATGKWVLKKEFSKEFFHLKLPRINCERSFSVQELQNQEDTICSLFCICVIDFLMFLRGI